MFKSVAIAAIALGVATSAGAVNLVTNPSFELGTGPDTIKLVGDTSITGWTVNRNNIFYASTASWNASDGDRSVELTGTRSGSIFQVIPFVVGQKYVLRFDYAADPALVGTGRILGQFDVGNNPNNRITFNNTPGRSPTNMGWQTFEYIFTALPGSGNTLAFRQASASAPTGITIDNIYLSAVPEPATWGLLMAGFGMIGFSMRRRRQTLSSVSA